MTVALVVAALTLGAWAVLRRATRPLPAPAEHTPKDRWGQPMGTLTKVEMARVIRGQR